MNRFVSEAEGRGIESAEFAHWRRTGERLICQPFGPRGDRYVWAGHSCRADGGGQERVGTVIRFAALSCYGEQMGSVKMRAWASPLACPLD